LALVAVCLAAASIVILLPTKAERGLSALIRACSDGRPIEGRLSGGFSAGAYSPTADGAFGFGNQEIELAEALLTEAVTQADDPPATLAYGRLLLIQHRTDQALATLRKAVVQMPESAEAHNDLGVCLLERGYVEDASEQFDRALRLERDMPEAIFNRALSYQKLQLWDAARRDLEHLRDLEADRGWRAEIDQTLGRIAEPFASKVNDGDVAARFEAAGDQGAIEDSKALIDANTESMRRYVFTDGLVKQHIEAAVKGDQASAARTLARIKLIGETLSERQGDRIVADMAIYLESLDASKRQAEISLLSDYAATARTVNSPKYLEARAPMERLARAFPEQGDPVFALLSAHASGVLDYSANDFVSCIRKLEKVLAQAQQRGWLYSQLQARNYLGIAHIRLGQDSAGLSHLDRVIAASDKYPRLKYKALQFSSVAFRYLGNYDKALAALREANRLFPLAAVGAHDVANNYVQAADLYTARENHRLALLCAEQSLALAGSDHNRAAQAASFMAVERARLGEIERSEQDLNLAFEHLEKVAPRQAQFTAPLVYTRAGDALLERRDTTAALEHYSRARAQADAAQDKAIPLIRALSGRAKAYLVNSDYQKAQDDLEEAARLIEDYRSNIADRKDRNDFFAASQNIFDQRIYLNVEPLGRQREAFDLTEQARARTLLDEMSIIQGAGGSLRDLAGAPASAQFSPLGLLEVQRALPQDLTLLEYAVTDRGTYLFVISRSGFSVRRSDSTAEMLYRLVGGYTDSLTNRAPIDEVKARGRILYQHLIEPIEDLIGESQALCVVPDKALHFLPFAALVDREDRYLVQKHPLLTAPSATVLVSCYQAQARKPLPERERILAVGNPLFDRARFEQLKLLPEAEDEADVSARFYRNRVVLKRAEATERRLRAEMASCDVAHLALHSLVQEKSPWLAALVLAGGAQEEGLLYLNDIYDITLPRTRLVVLSACQTALGQYYRGEGVVSLVRPFLAVGVPTVVASLWKVDSQATASLMIEFHKQRVALEGRTAHALGAAQLTVAGRETHTHPYFWAPFITVGAGT
jgi:CHAT domain-containing protein